MINLRLPYLYIMVIILLSFSLVHCESQSNNVQIPPLPDQEETSYEEEYSVTLKDTKLAVSDYLIGFNLVYPREKGAIWQDGKIEGYLKDVNTSVLRWPGGTVTTFYHWDELTGEGWRDSWDPENPVIPKPGSEFMDLDEYIELIRATGATPLVGINMSSARRWDRLEDGVNEALDLMRYCREQNFGVTYWYLDNEPYQHDSNGGEKTIEEYAELINLFVPRMREVNPDIKIIVNWRQAFSNRRSAYQKLLEIAGDNIDIIDVHWYWSWGDPNMEFWLSHTPTQLWTGSTYIEEIAYFRQMVTDFGYPAIQLASLEWNVGLGGDEIYQLTPHQMALIQAELMMQFIIGGLDMAAFWPIHWSSENITRRSFVNAENNEPQPNYSIFKFLGQLQGGSLIEDNVTKTLPHVLNLVVTDENVVRVCFLNKNKVNVRVNIDSDLFGDLMLQEAKTFALTEGGNNSEMRTLDLLEYTSEGVSFIAFNTSISMLTFKEK